MDRVIRFIGILWLSLVALLCCSAAYARNSPDILVLHSYHKGFRWSDDIQKGIEKTLAPLSPTFHVEYLDTKRNISPHYLDQLAEFLRFKLFHNRYDLIIAVDNRALEVVNRLAPRFFDEIPVLFAGINQFSPELIDSIRPGSVTGIEEVLPIAKGVDLALTLHPNTKKVYFVTDNSFTGRVLSRELNDMKPQFAVETQVLQQYSLEGLKARVSALEKDSLLYYLFFGVDSNGRFYEPEKVVEELAMVSTLPIYTCWDFNMVPGVMGGLMVSGEEQGNAVARQAIKVLNGIRPGTIPVEREVGYVTQLDDAQLKKWGISPSLLPASASIVNSPDHKVEVSFQVLLSGGFLVLLVLGAIYYHNLRLVRSRRELLVSESRFDTLFNQSTQFSGLLFPDGTIDVVNQSVLTVLKQSLSTLRGVDLRDLSLWQSSDLSHSQLSLYLQKARDGEAVRFSFELQLAMNSFHYLSVSIKPLQTPNGRVEMLLLEAYDLTKTKLAEKAIRENESHLRMVYEENPSLLLTLDAMGNICSLNRAAFRLLGYRASALLGKPISLLYADLHLRHQLPVYLNYVLCMGTQAKSREVCYQAENGKQLWFKETIRKLPGKKQFLLVGEDITENRELAQRLHYQATHDYLTGLYNRSYFEQKLADLIEQTFNTESHHALFYLDLDQFKVINDTFGHNAGDEAITQIGELFARLVPERAYLARLGGDEFGLIYPECSRNQALELGERLLQAVSDFHFLWQEKILTVGCSIGLVLIDKHSGLLHQVLSAADTACYAAKDDGRNRLHLYKPDDIELQKRKGEMEWVSRVQAALREQRFCLYAQPIRPISEQETPYLHYEVLARMIDEKGELVPPAQILPAIEHYHMADKLDKLLVEKTINWLQSNPVHVGELDVCSVNLSGQSVGDPDFVDYLITTLSHSGLPMEKLCFEITETTAIANFNQASKLISQLHLLGCKVALDDFGSGLSSFGYLKKLDVDYLKIDGMFVRDLALDKRDYAIVSSINELSKILGKKTIAEYVEDKACQALLEEIGVDYIQGFYLGRPLPLELVALAHSNDISSDEATTAIQAG